MNWLPIAAQALGDLGKSGALSGLLGGGTEVDQNVSQSTSAVLLSNVNNTIGPGTSQSGAITTPISQSQTQSKPLSTSPPVTYGDTFANDYQPGSFASGEGEQPVQAGFNPVLVVAVLAVGAFLLMSGDEK